MENQLTPKSIHIPMKETDLVELIPPAFEVPYAVDYFSSSWFSNFRSETLLCVRSHAARLYRYT